MTAESLTTTTRSHFRRGETLTAAARALSHVHYAYLLRCADDSYYAGYTTDPRRREAEHDAGDGAKYTRGRTPVELVHVEAFESQSAAMSREYALKQLSHDEKVRLAAETDVERVLDA